MARTVEKGEKQALLCQCGCGQPTRNLFAMGHDARHKGNLLRRYDDGDAEAGVELVQRGWRTQAELDERTTTARAKVEAKAARAVELEGNAKALTEQAAAKAAKRKGKHEQPVPAEGKHELTT